MKYYEMRDDVEAPRRWWLGVPHDALGSDVNPDIFTLAEGISASVPFTIPVRRDGASLDFTFGPLDLPIVNRRTYRLLQELTSGCCQFFPAHVENHAGDYALVNFLLCRKSMDESRSVFLKWTEQDHRADKTGQYRQVTKLIIDPARTGSAAIFRLWGWRVSVIVSENIQQAFLSNKITGVRFNQVTPGK